MTQHTLAAVAHPHRVDWTLERCELQGPAPGELLIRTLCCGICATDLKAAEGVYGTPLPAVLGHETVGEVLAVGEGVTAFAPGDRILASYGFCGQCAACTAGPPIYCERSFDLNVLGRRLDGSAPMHWRDRPITSHFFAQSGFATETVVRATCAIPVPTDIDPVLLAPLGCGVLTGGGIVAKLLGEPDGPLLVAGCGTVGLTVIALAAAAGHHPIVAVDRDTHRLEAACRAGATATLSTNGEDIAQLFRDVPPSRNVVDTTGATVVVEALQKALAPRGQLILAGVGDRIAEVDLRRLVLGGRIVRGTAEGEADPRELVPWLIQMLRSGALPIDDWVRACPFAEINQAAEDLAAGRIIKPVLRMTLPDNRSGGSS